MREMTITEALVELKTLNSRIIKATETEFIGVAQNSELESTAWKEFEERAKANFQSAIDLINERTKIKSAIVKSNAETSVKIGTDEMTVAEAIERKTSINYEKMLLQTLKREFASCKMSVEQNNAAVNRKLDALIESLVGSDKKVDPSEQTATAEAYIARNGYTLVDPIKIQNAIDTFEKRIDEFEANVDVALSVSNARTVITID